MRPDLSTIVLALLAVAFAIVAYLRDPSLPLIGTRNGLAMLWFIIPRLIPALILAGLLQVLVPQETVARYFGRAGGMKAILVASLAGVLTPGGPMISVPLMVVLANSGAGLPSPVAYITAWSLSGVHGIIPSHPP